MAGTLATSFGAALWNGVKSNSQQQNFGNNAQRQTAPYANNTATALALMAANISGIPTPQVTNPDTILVPGHSGYLGASHYFDYHFRIWIIPATFNLPNPQLSTNIPFQIWQTFPISQVFTSLNTVGSTVLTYDLVAGITTLHDHEVRTTNMQILPGESTIDAVTTFTFPLGTGSHRVIATVSDTFDIEFDVPVRERWEFLTDVLTSHNNTEQRIQLRPKPRLSFAMTISVLSNAEDRRTELLLRNMRVQSLIPMYQYSTNVTAPTAVSGTKIFCDLVRTNLRVAGEVLMIQPSTKKSFTTKVASFDADGFVGLSNIPEAVDSSWLVVPTVNCLLNDGTGFTVDSITGSMSVRAKSFEEPDLVRPGSTVTIPTYDGEPVLALRPLAGAPENFFYERNTIDSKTGSRDISSAWPTPIFKGRRRWLIPRNVDPASMDYWRTFWNLIRGANKRFLLPSWIPDLTLAATPTQGASQLDINEKDYPTLFFPYTTFKRLQIELQSGGVSYHLVSAATTSTLGVTTIVFSPALPDIPESVFIKNISFLNLVRAEDVIDLEHHAGHSFISFLISQVQV